MSEVSEKEFELLKSYLLSNSKIPENEVKVYILCLKAASQKSIITSGYVTDLQPMHQSTAGILLKHLANRGCFMPLVDSKGTRKGGRGRTGKYKLLPPGIAFRSIIEEYERARRAIEKIDEHFENLPEGQDDDENGFWIVKPEETAMNLLCNTFRKAAKSIKIYSHDCSWAKVSDIIAALKYCLARNVSIRIVCTNPGKKEKGTLKKLNLKPVVTTTPGNPFIIIDDELMFLPHKANALGSRYSLMQTRMSYTVENHKNLFEDLYNKGKNKKGMN